MTNKEHLPKLRSECSEADECSGNHGEHTVEIGIALVTDDETSDLVDAGEGALDDPPVCANVLAAFDASSCDAWCGVTSAEIPPTAAGTMAFFGVQFGRLFARSAIGLANRLDRVDVVDESLAVEAVGAGQAEGERWAAPTYNDCRRARWHCEARLRDASQRKQQPAIELAKSEAENLF